MFCLLKQCILWCLNSSGTLLKNIIVGAYQFSVDSRGTSLFFIFFSRILSISNSKIRRYQQFGEPHLPFIPANSQRASLDANLIFTQKRIRPTTVIHVVCKLCDNYRDVPWFDASLMFCRERGLSEVETRGMRWDEIFGDDDNDFISTLNN